MRSAPFAIGIWSPTAVLLTGAVIFGREVFVLLPEEHLASLADTLMPEAYETGGPTVALSTTAGFLISFVLATL